VNLSIKPSFERIKDIEKIEEINNLIELESKKNKNLIQLDFYNELMSGNKINSNFYLQDGLHLNNKGYQVIIKKLKKLLKKID
jgi:lysophospholipase L1-like esterase